MKFTVHRGPPNRGPVTISRGMDGTSRPPTTTAHSISSVSFYDRALGYPGDFFYHYTTRETAFEHILPTRWLRLSPAFRMRDPLEGHAALIGGAWYVPDDPDAQRAIARGERMVQASVGLRQLRRCSKVLSLTIDGRDYVGNAEIFGRGYARARMWEQYAENHQGVCLMLRRRDFEAIALRQLKSRSRDAWADEVRYTQRGILDELAATVMAPSNPGADLTAEELTQEHVDKHVKSIFFTKLMDWQSEHEYRFVESSTDEEYTSVDIGETLAGVILGHKFPDRQTPDVLALCDRVAAQVWRMSWDWSRPSPQLISPRENDQASAVGQVSD